MDQMHRPSPTMERLIAAIALGAMFLVLASIFRPHHTSAGVDSPAAPGSTDPHAGLISLGSIEESRYTVLIFAGQTGPRYSVYDRESGSELALLLTAREVAERFPDLPLPSLDFSSTVDGPLMTAETLGAGELPLD